MTWRRGSIAVVMVELASRDCSTTGHALASSAFHEKAVNSELKLASSIVFSGSLYRYRSRLGGVAGHSARSPGGREGEVPSGDLGVFICGQAGPAWRGLGRQPRVVAWHCIGLGETGGLASIRTLVGRSTGPGARFDPSLSVPFERGGTLPACSRTRALVSGRGAGAGPQSFQKSVRAGADSQLFQIVVSFLHHH